MPEDLKGVFWRDRAYRVVHDPISGERLMHRERYSWPIARVEADVLRVAERPMTAEAIRHALEGEHGRKSVRMALGALIGNGIEWRDSETKRPFAGLRRPLGRLKVTIGPGIWNALPPKRIRSIVFLRPENTNDSEVGVFEALVGRVRALYPQATVNVGRVPVEGWAKAVRRFCREHSSDLVYFFQGRGFDRFAATVPWSLWRLPGRYKVWNRSGIEVLVTLPLALSHFVRNTVRFLMTHRRLVPLGLAWEVGACRLLDQIMLGERARSRARKKRRDELIGPAIAVISSGGLGDLAHSAAGISALKAAYPRSRITIYVREACEAVAKAMVGVDEVEHLELFYGGNPRNPFTWLGWAWNLAKLQRRGFDIALLMKWYGFGSRPLSWGLTLLYLTRAPKRISPTWRMHGALQSIPFATEYVPVDGGGLGPSQQGVEVARRALPEAFVLEYPRGPFLTVPTTDATDIDLYLRGRGIDPEHDNVVAFAPCTGKNKVWSFESFARLGDRLAEEQMAKIVLFAERSQVLYLQDVAQRMRTPAAVVSDLDRYQIFPLISRLKLLVANDSGPLHIATMLGVPVIGIFGPTDPTRWAEASERVRILREGDCPPCGDQGHCKMPRRVCMDSVTVEMVAREAARFLERPRLGLPSRQSRYERAR